MEDEGFVDDDFIEETAVQYLGRYGESALPLLRERARVAGAAGDYLLSQTWQEIVAAAERMMGFT